jgi:K(+)-stimulated pyrophosphate-energized sodium pump
MLALGLVILCGLLSIAYGIWAIRAVMASDAGNARMQEIAAAIQEGAQAYLTRQYRRSASSASSSSSSSPSCCSAGSVAIGFLIGAILSAACGLHRHARVGARQRPHRAGVDEVSLADGLDRLQAPARSPAAGRRPRAARRRCLLRHSDRYVWATARTAAR